MTGLDVLGVALGPFPRGIELVAGAVFGCVEGVVVSGCLTGELGRGLGGATSSVILSGEQPVLMTV